MEQIVEAYILLRVKKNMYNFLSFIAVEFFERAELCPFFETEMSPGAVFKAVLELIAPKSVTQFIQKRPVESSHGQHVN